MAHLRGSAGLVAYNAYLAQSSGTFSGFATDGKGSGAGLGMALDSEGFLLGIDYAQITVECSPGTGDQACVDDNEQTRWGVAVNLGGFGAHYFVGEDETGADTEETTNIDAVYLFEAGDARLMSRFLVKSVNLSQVLRKN